MAFSSIAELRAGLDAGEVSAVDLARDACTRLDTDGRRQHLVAALSLDRALEEAERADALIRTGRQTTLTGIPYGAKDQLAAKGMPTSWGSRVYEKQYFDYDAAAIERLQRSGSVLVAKLSMMELGGAGGYVSAGASASGPAQNPWSSQHWAGGSSGGSAAAVGAGLVPFALAGDALGSIILPAAFCGVTGLRPTYGSVSSFGSMPGSWTLGKVGVIGRSAADCGTVFEAIAGKDPRDPTSADRSQNELPRAPYRLGVMPTETTPSDAVEELTQDALQLLQELGMAVTEVRLPARDYVALAKRIRAGEAAAAHEELIRDPELLATVVDERQREGLRSFLEEPLCSFARALQERAYANQEIHHLFDEVDFLVAPSVGFEAPSLDADLSDQPFRHSTHLAIGALAGLPGLSIPIGFGSHGLPVGLTITGRPFADAGVLDVAAQYQAATDWHRYRPSGHDSALAGSSEST